MWGAREPRLPPLPPRWAERARTIRAELDPAALRRQVESLPAPRNRFHSPEAMAATDAHLVRAFRESGWTAERRPYAYEDVEASGDATRRVQHPRLTGANVVATREGERSSDAVIVVAHHDTVRDSPGADDNTAGVAGLLELARLLGAAAFDRTVLLAAVDMEEIGLLGSRRLLEELTAERKLLAAVVFETMSYTCREPGTQFLPPGLGALYPGQVRRIRSRGSVGDFTTLLYRGGGTALAARFAGALEHLAGAGSTVLLRDPVDLPVLGPLLARTVPFVRDFARSDHVSFWERSIPAILVTDTADFRNPHYHRPTDTPETLDYRRLADIVAATAVLVELLAGAVRPGGSGR